MLVQARWSSSPSPAPKRRPSKGRSCSRENTKTAACCPWYAVAAPTKHQVRINPKPHVRHIDVEGKGSPHLTRQRRYSNVHMDSSHCPKPERKDTTQAIEAAKEFEAIVKALSTDCQVPCDLECSDFGLTCQHSEKLYQLSCAAHNAGLEFLADTGSEEDLISRSDHEFYYSEIPIDSASRHVSLMTANGGQICYAVNAHDRINGRMLRTREHPTRLFCWKALHRRRV